MKLYYHPLSFPALGTIFTAEAAGVDYESQMVNLQKGEHKAPEYLAINPYGRVPALSDGDFTLSESCLLYTSPSPRDQRGSRMPSSA